MPQIEPILLTGVSETALTSRDFSVEPLGGSKDGLTSYVGGDIITDKTTSVAVGPPTIAALQSTLTVSLHRPSKTSRISKVRIKLVTPIAALDVAGLPTTAKSHENSVDVTYTFSEKSTEAERSALDDVFLLLLQNEPAVTVIRQLKSMY